MMIEKQREKYGANTRYTESSSEGHRQKKKKEKQTISWLGTSIS